MNPKQALMLPIWMFLFLNIISAQHEQENIYSQAEAYYGYNDLLVNGPLYMPQYPRAKGTPFFLSSELFQETILYIKGEKFTNEELQYDIHQDCFFLNKSPENGKTGTLKLSEDILDSVHLGKHIFVKTSSLVKDNFELGFVEIIHRGKETFIAKYSKYLEKSYDEENLFGKYSDLKTDKYLVINGELIPMNSKKAFLKHFNSKKLKLKSYMRKYKIKYRKANPQQMKNLLNYCYEE